MLFARLDTPAAIFVKGASFTYEPGGEREGVLHLKTVDRAPRAFRLLWKGVLQFAYEVASAQGSIDNCKIDAGGKGAAFQVAWSAAAIPA